MSILPTKDSDDSKMQELCSNQPAHQLRVESQGTPGWHVSWPVAVQRLHSNDKQIVSPPFEVAGAVFRLMLKPKEIGKGKGKSGFRHARGQGHVELKCEVGSDVTLADLCFSVSINGRRSMSVTHNFARTPVGCFPRGTEDWDFAGAVNKCLVPPAFTVHLDLEPSL